MHAAVHEVEIEATKRSLGGLLIRQTLARGGER
jgi:hypothetical protein